MKKVMRLVALLSLAIFASCGLEPFEEDSADSGVVETETEASSMSEESSLFLEDGDSGKFIFETNDSSYINEDGYTIWTTRDTNEGDAFAPVSVTVSKESGVSEAGFGIVFCAQEIEGVPFMMAVLVNANGMYTVAEVVDGAFSHLDGGWKYFSGMRRGYGIRNEIAVTYDGGTDEFLLLINGESVKSFSVPEGALFRGSKSGFVVVIADNENFPDEPVRVVFEK